MKAFQHLFCASLCGITRLLISNLWMKNIVGGSGGASPKGDQAFLSRAALARTHLQKGLPCFPSRARPVLRNLQGILFNLQQPLEK